jgi:hypothetical protein
MCTHEAIAREKKKLDANLRLTRSPENDSWTNPNHNP